MSSYKPWFLKDLVFNNNSPSVFSTFSCGGGSSMGYKLAGFNVLGCVEIEKKILNVYKKNLKPKFPFNMGLKDFNNLESSLLPRELFSLDILDGSPPCSVFSTAGSRENKWGGEFKFRESQSKQALDDLFFVFLDTVKKLGPKVVVAENVAGLLIGNAKGFVKLILERFYELGYECQIFDLNSKYMGLPQERRRVFFIANKLGFKPLSLNFNDSGVSVRDALVDANKNDAVFLNGKLLEMWNKTTPGNYAKAPSGNTFGYFYKANFDIPILTITAKNRVFHPLEPRAFSSHEIARLSTFPEDYDFLDQKAVYLCGMSVPPFMMFKIANQIRLQWFSSSF